MLNKFKSSKSSNNRKYRLRGKNSNKTQKAGSLNFKLYHNCERNKEARYRNACHKYSKEGNVFFRELGHGGYDVMLIRNEAQKKKI